MTYGTRFTMLTRYVLNCQHVLFAELAPDGALLYPLWTSEHWSSDDGGGSEQAHGIPLETLCPDTEQLARFKTGELLTLHVSLPLFVTPDVQQVMVPLMYRGELIGSMGIAYSNSYNGHSSAPATHLYGQDMVLLKIVARLATLIVQGEREQREKERLVQSWQASNEEVEHIHEMKQGFVSIVNREIRATLLNMQRASEIISHQKTSREVGREFALDIYSDARRLVHMIDHMTNLARLEGSRIKLYATWLNINTLITEVLRQWRLVLARRRIQVQTQLANTMPLLQGDRNRLLQVINTMLDYILRYVPQDSELLIQSYVEEQFVRVSMYCRSVYIPSTVLERIFSPSDGEHDTVEGQIRHGYGVQQETALQEIVQHHGGHVWAESTPEKGCAFHFTVRFATATMSNGDERI
jgi:K+-sensing histidine kinase KdpD